MSGDEPFETAYYPGVFEKDSAIAITIRAGEKLENYDIHIPSQLPTTVIQGVLLYSDGHAVAREFIDFKAEGEDKGTERNASTVTDSEGRFSFKVLQGTVGMLRGWMSLYAGKYFECHHANKLLMEKGGRGIKVESSPVRIEANTSSRNVRLVLPFSFCPKKEEK